MPCIKGLNLEGPPILCLPDIANPHHFICLEERKIEMI
jgi:hypothetical protein